MKGVAHDPNGADIRVVNVGSAAWLVAADVLKLLGFSRANNMLRTIGDNKKPLTLRQVTAKRIEVADARSADTSSGRNLNAGEVNASNCGSTTLSFPNRGMICVNETGVYDLIGASWKPEARKFRKDGNYIRGEEEPNVDDDTKPNTTDHAGPRRSILWTAGYQGQPEAELLPNLC